MGLAEIGFILLSVTIPGIVLVVAAALRRRGRLGFLKLPPKLVPPAATAFMMIGTLLVLGLITFREPRSASAMRSGAEATTAEAEGLISTVRIHVFALENWGEIPKRHKAGDRFARVVIDTLRDHGLYVQKGHEHRVPLDIFHAEENTEQHVKAHYRKIVPFISVWGSVTGTRDGDLEALVHVQQLDKTITVTTLLDRELKFPASITALEQTAEGLAEEIIELAASD